LVLHLDPASLGCCTPLTCLFGLLLGVYGVETPLADCSIGLSPRLLCGLPRLTDESLSEGKASLLDGSLE
jgi:hypothetical protein